MVRSRPIRPQCQTPGRAGHSVRAALIVMVLFSLALGGWNLEVSSFHSLCRNLDGKKTLTNPATHTASSRANQCAIRCKDDYRALKNLLSISNYGLNRS